MAKHPTSSRVHREDHGPDDAFVTAIKRAYAWGSEHVVLLAIILAILIAAGSVAIWMTSQQRQLEAEAAARFNQVQQTVASGNTQLAIRDLQSYLNRFGSTRAANQGRLILAGILLAEDRAQEAVEALGDLPDDLDEPYGLAAARVEAAAHEETGDLEAAVTTYRRIADDARFAYERREALADAARIRLDNGQPDRAARLYEEILGTFEENEAGQEYYAMWLAEARAQADGGITGSPAASDTSSGTASDTTAEALEAG